MDTPTTVFKTASGSTGEGKSHTMAGSQEAAALQANLSSSEAAKSATMKTTGEVQKAMDNGSGADRIGSRNAWSPSCE